MIFRSKLALYNLGIRPNYEKRIFLKTTLLNQNQNFKSRFNVTYDIQYSAIYLASLENRLIQLPKIIDNVELQQDRLSLDDTENMLNSIVQHRRIKTTTETIMEYLN